MSLDPKDIEAIAFRVAELVRPKPEHRLVTTDELARELDVNPSWVYRNKEKLGVKRLGGSKTGRLRFDLAEAKEKAAVLQTSPVVDRPKEKRRRGRPRKTVPPGMRLLGGPPNK